MKEDSMLMCSIAFVLGYLVSHMMRGNGLSVGGWNSKEDCEKSIPGIIAGGGSCPVHDEQYSCQQIIPGYWSTSCSPVNH